MMKLPSALQFATDTAKDFEDRLVAFQRQWSSELDDETVDQCNRCQKPTHEARFIWQSPDGWFCDACCRALRIDTRGEGWQANDVRAAAWRKRVAAIAAGIVSAHEDYMYDLFRLASAKCVECDRFLDQEEWLRHCCRRCRRCSDEGVSRYERAISWLAQCALTTVTSQVGEVEYSGLQGALYRARRHGLPATLTAAQWSLTVQHFADRCAYCSKEQWSIIEHVMPISRGGGTTWTNCLPSCPDCNATKGSRTIQEWMAKRYGRGSK